LTPRTYCASTHLTQVRIAGGFGSVASFSKQVGTVLESVVSQSMATQAEAV